MPKTRIAEKNQKMVNILKKKGLKSVPRDPKTGEMRTVTIKKDIQSEKKPVRRAFMDRKICYFCPKCGRLIEFRKKMHRIKCSRCGQYLDWKELEDMRVAHILVSDSGEAAYWAEKYEYYNGTVYGMDINKWRLHLKDFPKILFFPFPDGKGYGRFMRLAAKDAVVITYF